MCGGGSQEPGNCISACFSVAVTCAVIPVIFKCDVLGGEIPSQLPNGSCVLGTVRVCISDAVAAGTLHRIALDVFTFTLTETRTPAGDLDPKGLIHKIIPLRNSQRGLSMCQMATLMAIGYP